MGIAAIPGGGAVPYCPHDKPSILHKKSALLPYKAVVVDEAKDMGAEAYRLLAAISPASGGQHEVDILFLVGGVHRRIYGRMAPMAKFGIDDVGRSRRLNPTSRIGPFFEVTR